jgi:hypothetical protein
MTAALAVGLAGGLAACGEDSPPSEPTPTVVAKKPTLSPSPTQDELDLESAEEAALAYEDLLDDITKDPSTARWADGSALASGDASQDVLNIVNTYRDGGWHAIGDQTLEILDSAKNEDGTWNVDLCVDLTDVDVLGKDGESVVSPDRIDRSLSHYTVAKREDNGQFIVTLSSSDDDKSC